MAKIHYCGIDYPNESNNNAKAALPIFDVNDTVCEHHITHKGVCAACGESDMSQDDCY